MLKRLSHPFIAELKRFAANQNATLGPVVTSLSELVPIRSSNKLEDIRRKQQKLSEVTDMIHAAHVFHRCVSDSTPTESCDAKTKRLHQDNIMSLLVGDYLLAQSSVDMADLRFPRTVGLIARGLEDYTLGEFLKLQLVERLKDHEFDILNLKDGLEQHAELTCGSLLSNACLSATLLAGQPSRGEGDPSESLSELAFKFGFHTGTAQRLMEILHTPNAFSETDKVLSEALDVRIFDKSMHSHLDKSRKLLSMLPDGPSKSNLVDFLEKIKNQSFSQR